MTISQAISQASSRRPIPLCKLSRMTGLAPRTCKAAVQRLRRDGYPIVSLRGKPSGYYLDVNNRDYAEGLYGEALTRIRTMRGMTNSRHARELLGQLALEVAG